MPLNEQFVDSQKVSGGFVVRLRWKQDGQVVMQLWFVRDSHHANHLTGFIEQLACRTDVNSYTDVRSLLEDHPNVPDPVFETTIGAYQAPADPYRFARPPLSTGAELVFDAHLDVGWIVPVGDHDWEGRAYGGKEMPATRDKALLIEEIIAIARRMRGRPWPR